MPAYEATLIFKGLARPQLVHALKRTCTNVMEKGGLIRKMENLGYRELPYTRKAKGEHFSQGNYITIYFDAPVEGLRDLERDCNIDKDILSVGILRQKEEPPKPCDYGPCLFGEVPNPDHDKIAYKKSVLRRYKNRW